MNSYPEELRSAWRAATAKRSAQAPTVVSTFAGMGGSSLGWKMAGFDVRLAVEWDADAVATYKLNFPTSEVFHGDIAELTPERALELAHVRRGDLDVLDGSPPCQGFSTAGTRLLDDPRNKLFMEFVRLLSGLQPRAFVMENVSGMIKGQHRKVFLEALAALKGAGYEVRCQLVEAKWLGVPQIRQRVIFIGLRKDLGKTPEHPKPVSKPQTCEQALLELRQNEVEREWLLTECGKRSSFSTWSLVKPGRTILHLVEITGKSTGFGAIKFHPQRPAPTIVKNDSVVSNRGGMHWAERRRFTVPEYMRFSSIPDEYQWPQFETVGKTWSNAVARIGNSVPPFLMRAIAREVRKSLGYSDI